MSALCRDCLHEVAESEPRRCPACNSPRLAKHAELQQLSIAHLDCDAFYASVEKRDRPELRDLPVIVGGGTRGVVSTACYVARSYGVRSAMPMFKALKACPKAVVIRPDMAKYARVAQDVRAQMEALTPLVEPLSLDEAFMDLSGTERLHKHAPAHSLAALAQRIERDIGITVSIGLSYNKFLAKVASELDKPRGFAVIGRAEAKTFLAGQPVTIIPGVGPAMAGALGRAGILTAGDVQRVSLRDMVKQFGSMGEWLHGLAQGEDRRRISPDGERKSISAETTFHEDISSVPELSRILWRLCEKVHARAKSQELGGRTIALKLKTADFQSLTRRKQPPRPTQSADILYEAGLQMLRAEAIGGRYRLIGIGLADLVPGAQCDLPDLFSEQPVKKLAAERAVDAVRAKFGASAIAKGRGLPASRRKDS
jgi:DNA polymerase IV